MKAKYPSLEDRLDHYVFSIDPPNSTDFDDAFSIQEVADVTKISIYISNVTLWLDYLQLWSSFSRRISTIYLPDKKRPMLPTILTDNLCSLKENNIRFAFVLDLFIRNGEIIDTNYANCFISVTKNYRYEEPHLKNDAKYSQLAILTHHLAQKYPYLNGIKDSHDVVSYLMIMMNYHTAKELINFNAGIFRSTICKEKNNPIMESDLSTNIDTNNSLEEEKLPEKVCKFIQLWKTTMGQYIDGAELTNKRHHILNMEVYIHISSPIRRLVDILNMIKIQQLLKICDLSCEAEQFYQLWLTDLEYINTTMRSIRKVQCDCNLLNLCCKSEEIMDKEYDGYLFDKMGRNNGLFHFCVYIPELNMSSRIVSRENFDNYSCKKVKLYLFHNEEKLKKKIRLQIL